jgi:hypothetical protein
MDAARIPGPGHNGAAAVPKTFDGGEIAPIGHAYLGFRMNALARSVEGRSFQMKGEHGRESDPRMAVTDS